MKSKLSNKYDEWAIPTIIIFGLISLFIIYATGNEMYAVFKASQLKVGDEFIIRDISDGNPHSFEIEEEGTIIGKRGTTITYVNDDDDTLTDNAVDWYMYPDEYEVLIKH